jgi:hypothetical protein
MGNMRNAYIISKTVGTKLLGTNRGHTRINLKGKTCKDADFMYVASDRSVCKVIFQGTLSLWVLHKMGDCQILSKNHT